MRPELLSEANTTKPPTTFAKGNHGTGAFVPLSTRRECSASHHSTEHCEPSELPGNRVLAACGNCRGRRNYLTTGTAKRQAFCQETRIIHHDQGPLPTLIFMTPTRGADDAITNAAELTADDVAHQRVVCPCCGVFVFRMWPEGWDAHAEHRCAGLSVSSGMERKQEFKSRCQYLFR